MVKDREIEIELIVSESIVKEIRRVLYSERLKKYHKRPPEEIEEFIHKNTEFAKVVLGNLNIKAIPADPTDDKFLAVAVEGEADFIVSGDHHLTDLKSYQGIKIVKPAEFLKLWESGKI